MDEKFECECFGCEYWTGYSCLLDDIYKMLVIILIEEEDEKVVA